MASAATMGSTLQELVCGTGAAADLSAPLSAADLQSCLDRITLHSDQVKDRVYKTITSHHSDFASMIRHANATSADVEDIEENLGTILKMLQGEGSSAVDGHTAMIDRELRASAAELKQIRAELGEKEQAVQSVRIVAALHSRIVRLDEHAGSGDLRAAALASAQLRNLLRRPDKDGTVTSPTATPRVAAFEILQSEFHRREEKLRTRLLGLVERAVVLDPKRRDLVCRARVELDESAAAVDITLTEVWAAVETLGLQGTAYARLADAIFSGLVDPILRDPTVEIAIEEDSAKPSGDSRLRWPSNRLMKEAAVKPSAVYGKLLPAVLFLARHVACGDRSRLQTLGRMLWPRCADAIINGCLGKAIPSATSELASFQAVAEETVQFELALAHEGFLPEVPPILDVDAAIVVQGGEGGAVGGKLSAFVADVDIHFASKKRKDVLARARALLVNSDFSSTFVPAEAKSTSARGSETDAASEEPSSSGGGAGDGGQKGPETRERARKRFAKAQQQKATAEREGPAPVGVGGGASRMEGAFFRMEPMHVSKAAQSLVALAHEALQEACLSTTRTASELYRAARDALLLYRAVVPVKHAARLETVPLLAVLFHNDCLYIVNTMLTLGLQYRKGLPTTLQHVASLVDMAPVFRHMAMSTLEHQLAEQSASLIEMMDSGGGFSGTDNDKRYQDVRRALRGALHHLRHLAAVWKPVAAWRTYTHLMASLIHAAANHFASEITSMADLAVDETVQLRALSQEFLQGLPPLLDPAGSSTLPSLPRTPPSGAPSVQTSTEPDQDPEAAPSASPSAGSGAEGSSPEDAQRRLEDAAPASKKLQRLADLLDMSLVSITQAWESGDLVSCGFSRKEVCALIKAIFSDTPLRARSLEMITSVEPFQITTSDNS